jgi:hypothetical protein
LIFEFACIIFALKQIKTAREMKKIITLLGAIFIGTIIGIFLTLGIWGLIKPQKSSIPEKKYTWTYQSGDLESLILDVDGTIILKSKDITIINRCLINEEIIEASKPFNSFTMPKDSILIFSAERGFILNEDVRIFRIADENTCFNYHMPHGSVVYSIESDNMYLCRFNKCTKTINTGVTKLLPKVNGNIYITKKELDWLNETITTLR